MGRNLCIYVQIQEQAVGQRDESEHIDQEVCQDSLVPMHVSPETEIQSFFQRLKCCRNGEVVPVVHLVMDRGTYLLCEVIQE